MAKQTMRGRSSSKRRSPASKTKKRGTRKPPPRTSRKKTRRKKRKPALTFSQVFLILALFAVVVTGISLGVLHFRGRKIPAKPSCRAKHGEVTTFILVTLFQHGLSRKEVTWRNHKGKTCFTLKADQRKFKKIFTALQAGLAQRFRGISVEEKGHGILLIRCGKKTTHRLAFIPPPAPIVSYPGEKPQKPARAIVPPVPAKKGKGVKVAIVIDDIGNDLAIARDLLSLPAPVTLSIFPFAPHAREIAREAREKGYDILMHLPMEPEGYPGKGKDPGPGALYVKMTPDEIARKLNEDLDRIPEVCGINNHMGSRFTSDRKGMEVVMEVLKKRNKFFLDSRTSTKSVGYQVAREDGIPTIKRDVFLDNTRDVQKIREQLDTLIEDAKKRGYAVGIGHPHRATYLALKKALPVYQGEGIEFVFVSSLVR